MECHVVTGEFDYFMLLHTRDSDCFNRLHTEQPLHLPGIDG
jgi:DNA-binding Lrp family transcriptional regulator